MTQSNSDVNSLSSTWTTIPSRTIDVNTLRKSYNTQAAFASSSLFLFTSTITPTATINPLSCLPKTTAENYGLVRWIESGDTIVVDIAGRLQTVKYLGIEAASVKSDIEYYGPPAATQNTLLVKGQVIRMIPDGEDRDDYGRLNRYVIVYNTNTFANFDLLRAGYARVLSESKALTCYSTFILAEEYARKDQSGLWGPLQTPQPTITQNPSSIPTPGTLLTLTPTIEMTPSATPSLTPTITTTIQTATNTATNTSTPITPSPTLTQTQTLENTLTATP
jgi:endonuclease YncB( thermonuclease family)